MAASPAVFFVIDFPWGPQNTAQRLRLSAPFAHVRAYRADEVAAARSAMAAGSLWICTVRCMERLRPDILRLLEFM